MDDVRPRQRPADAPVMYLSPSRSELVRYFAWGYFSRRELHARLRASEPPKRPGRPSAQVRSAA